MLHHNYSPNVEDGIQIREYTINKENVANSSQLIPVKVEKISGSIAGKVKKIESQVK